MWYKWTQKSPNTNSEEMEVFESWNSFNRQFNIYLSWKCYKNQTLYIQSYGTNKFSHLLFMSLCAEVTSSKFERECVIILRDSMIISHTSLILVTPNMVHYAWCDVVTYVFLNIKSLKHIYNFHKKISDLINDYAHDGRIGHIRRLESLSCL